MLFSRTTTQLRHRRQIDMLHWALSVALAALLCVSVSTACGGPQNRSGERTVVDAPVRSSESPHIDLNAEAIRHIDESHFEIRRHLWDRLPSFVSSERRVRFVPTVKNGKRIGLKLFAIQPESLLDVMGFQNGDTIHALNGRAILASQDLLLAYGDAKDQAVVIAVLTRKGAQITLQYRIV